MNCIKISSSSSLIPWLIFFLFFFMLTGCATETLSGAQCENVDWYRVGHTDGTNGIEAGTFLRHIDSCKIPYAEVDQEKYNLGHAAGLPVFCTPENCYKMGLVGYVSGERCPELQYPEFAEQFRLGRQIHSLNSEKTKIAEQKRNFADDKSLVADVQRVYSLLAWRSPTEHLDKKEEKLSGEIRLLQAKAPINAPAPGSLDLLSSMTTLAPINLTEVRNASGAFAGTFLGFGIGHAIQGRYKQSGWMWTAGEVATLGTLMATVSGPDPNCRPPPRNQNQDSQSPNANYCGGQVNGWALLAWLGFRVWQSYDLWTFSNSSLYDNSAVIAKPDGFLYVYSF